MWTTEGQAVGHHGPAASQRGGRGEAREGTPQGGTVWREVYFAGMAASAS